MKIRDDKAVMRHFEGRLRLRTKLRVSGVWAPPSNDSFTYDKPHSCRFCSDITIDGEACRDSWQKLAAQDETLVRGAGPPGAPEGLRLNRGIRDVVAAAQGQCALYEYLADSVLEEDTSSGTPLIGADSHDILFCLSSQYRVQGFSLVTYWMDENGQAVDSRHRPLSCVATEGKENPAVSYLLARPHELDRSSANSVSFCKEAFHHCMKNHQSCRYPASPHLEESPPELIQESDLPARLLEIQQENGGTSVKVVQTGGASSNLTHDICRAGYASLSYCWGQDQPMKLTTKTLEIFKAGIDYNGLPKTIQDAICVARWIPMRYIWIDALCILQDSPADKEVEISRMPLYYGRNTVTISAASSSHCGEGILHEGSVEFEAGPFQINFSTPSGVGTVQLCLSKQPKPEPIEQRAWTLQESILSRRVLVFASDQIYWHCHQGQRQCNDPPAKENTMEPSEEFATAAAGVATYTTKWLVGPHARVPGNWDAVAHRYTKRSLSSENDKLLAVSALAAYVFDLRAKQEPSLAYLAGLFVATDNMWSWIEQLLWSSIPRRATRSQTYRAPSWSWASLDSVAGMQSFRALLPPPYNYRKYHITFAVGGFGIDLSLPSAPFGSVRSAHISAASYLKRLIGTPAVKVTIPETTTNTYTLLLRLQPGTTFLTHDELFLFPDTTDDEALINRALGGSEPVYLFELLPPLSFFRTCKPSMGLILRADSSPQTVTFHRIGVYAFYVVVGEDIAALQVPIGLGGGVKLDLPDIMEEFYNMGIQQVKLV